MLKQYEELSVLEQGDDGAVIAAGLARLRIG